MIFNITRAIPVTVFVVFAMICSTRGFAKDTAKSKEVLAEELISLMRLDRDIKIALDEKVKMEELADPGLSQEQKTERRHQVEKLYNWEALKQVWVQIYAEMFTAEDLRGMITFFKSPVGQKWIDTQPEVQNKTMQRMQAFMKGADEQLHSQR